MIDLLKPKTIFQEAIAVLIFSIVVAIGFNYLSGRDIMIKEKSVEKEFVPDSILFNSKTIVPDSISKRGISLSQLRNLIATKSAVVIDARNSEAYEKGHVPSAINVPFLNMFDYIAALSSMPADTLIIVYCEGINCELSSNLAASLKSMSFTRIFIYQDGIEGWQNANLPEEFGK
jgi:rhodanese-related sulfurtransferase